MVEGIDVDTSSSLDCECEACIQAKHSRAPFPQISNTKYREIGELVSSDMWGPARIESLQHNLYYITYCDAASHYTTVKFLRSRAEVAEKTEQYDQWLKTQRGTGICALRVDNAREYTDGRLKQYMENKGMDLQLTAPYSPSQNGVAERLNRTLVEHACAMLIAHNLPLFLWEEAVSYAL